MTALLQVRNRRVWHSVFNDKHARPGGTGPKRRGKMLGVPSWGVDRFLEIVGGMNVSEEKLGDPLVLLVSSWRAPSEVGFTVSQSHGR
jgi:hypothetical protein